MAACAERRGALRRIAAAAAFASPLVTNTASAAARFVDPLDSPAATTRLLTTSPLLAVARAGGRLVAAGPRGLVVFSDDGGRFWRQAAVPLSSDLVALHFGSTNHGWAAGHDGVLLRSADAGATWQRQLDGRLIEAMLRRHFEALAAAGDPRGAALLAQLAIDHANGPEQPLLDVAFDAAGRGFACGAFGLLLGTEDGGASWASWIERIDNPRGLHLNALCASGGRWFIASEQGTVFTLGAGGERFEARATGHAGTLFGVIGAGAGDAVIAYGLRGGAFRSVDGGATWRRLATGLPSSLMAATRLRDGRVAWASQQGRVIVSADAGASFTAYDVGGVGPIAGMAQAGGDLVAVGAMGVLRIVLPAF